MKRTILRWVILIVSFGVLGPLARALLAGLRAPDGSNQASLLLSSSWAMALAGFAAATGLALLAGIAGSRLLSVRTGLFAAGLVLLWTAWPAGMVDGMIRVASSGASVFRTLIIEGIILGALLGGLAWLIVHARPADQPSDASPKPRSKDASTSAGLMALGACLVAGAAGGFIVAQSTLPGQAVGAAFFAGLAGAFVAGLMDPKGNLFRVAAVLALLTAAGPAFGAVMHGEQALRDAFAGTLTPLAKLTPLHWFAGLLLGIPTGSSWAASFIKKEA